MTLALLCQSVDQPWFSFEFAAAHAQSGVASSHRDGKTRTTTPAICEGGVDVRVLHLRERRRVPNVEAIPLVLHSPSHSRLKKFDLEWKQ